MVAVPAEGEQQHQQQQGREESGGRPDHHLHTRDFVAETSHSTHRQKTNCQAGNDPVRIKTDIK